MGILKNNLVSLPKFREIKHIILQKKILPSTTFANSNSKLYPNITKSLGSGIFSANVIWNPLCLLKVEAQPKVISHIGHCRAKFWSWVPKCCFKLSSLANFLSHFVQTYSPFFFSASNKALFTFDPFARLKGISDPAERFAKRKVSKLRK